MTVGINIILAVSLNVATGYLGQLPLGHAGFMAVGAYTCALFTNCLLYTSSCTTLPTALLQASSSARMHWLLWATATRSP